MSHQKTALVSDQESPARTHGRRLAKTGQNIVLIGMPGSGKSTVGVILAKQASYGFLDTDVLIQVSEERSLQAILDTEGHRRCGRLKSASCSPSTSTIT